MDSEGIATQLTKPECGNSPQRQMSLLTQLRGSSGANRLQIHSLEQKITCGVEWCHTAASQTSVHADLISEIKFFLASSQVIVLTDCHSIAFL